MLSRRTLSLSTGRISYLEKGSAERGRPTFVLIHGLMGTAATFMPLMQALPADRHVIAIDLPGAGGSDRDSSVNPALYSISRALMATLDSLGLERPMLVGHSHGGAVALHLAASEPRRISGLVLLAPAHPYFRHADQLIAFYLSPLGRLFAHTMPWYPQWVQMMGLRSMAGPQSWDSPERLVPYRENLRIRGTIPFLLRLLGTWHSDLRELRHLLEAPFRLRTLLLWGDHDRAVPLSTAHSLARHLENVQLQVLPGVGHRPAEERPQVCARLLEDWYIECQRPRRGPVSPAG